MRNLKGLRWLLVAGLAGVTNLYSQTITNPRSPAEFEEVQGVVVCWFEQQYLFIFWIVAEHGGWTEPLLQDYQGLMNTQRMIIQEALNEGIDVYVLDDTAQTLYAPGYYGSSYKVADTLPAL